MQEAFQQEPIRVGIVGASGYSGLELVRLLLGHRGFRLTYVSGNQSAGEPLVHLYPQLTGRTTLKLEKFDASACADACDAAFVALPSGHAGEVAASLWSKGLKVVDLSGDLRLKKSTYETWYGKDAVPTHVQEAAVYGLTEWNRQAVSETRLVSNPGCFATASLLAILPAARAKLALPDVPIVIDAKSGVSGAGRTLTQNVHLAELSDNFYPYKVGVHQHTPEIEQFASLENAYSILLTTQLLPISRGIAVSAYLNVPAEVSQASIFDIYKDSYKDSYFVHILEAGMYPQIKHVTGSNHCHIGLRLDERSHILQVFATIDNLQKGAAGQALQNMNVMYGLPETLGLESVGMYP